jgi:multidrug efflux system membrane fusion protein
MRVVLVLTGVVVLLVGGLVYFQELSVESIRQVWRRAVPEPVALTPPPPSAIPVLVAKATTEDVPIYLTGIGTVQAYNTVNVQPQVDGKISEILFQEGQDVKAGDRLALLDPRPYQAQLQQQIASRVRDMAMLKGARADLARYLILQKKDSTTQQQVDNQQALVSQYEGTVANDEAQIDYARTQLDFTTISSPIEGRVGIRQVDAGNVLRADQRTTIVVITQLHPISVVFTVSADAVARNNLGIGLVHVPVIALGPDNTTELDRGAVELVDNQVDPSTGTIKLKASFPNAALKLWPGNFVNGRIIVETRRGGITVPSVAVRHGPRCDYAWIIRPDQTTVTRCVTVGQVFAGRTLIEKGLVKGAEVVVDGQYRLDEGSKIEIRKPPAK